MRLLWARIGTPHCPKCGKEIHQQTIDQIIDRLMALEEKTRVQLLAPVIRGKKGEHVKVFEDARKQGYVRVRVDGEIHDLSEEFKLAKTKSTTLRSLLTALSSVRTPRTHRDRLESHASALRSVW